MSTGAFAQVVARWGAVVTAVDVPGEAFPDVDLIDTLDAVHVLQQQVAALALDLIHACDVRDIAGRDGSTSLRSWLAGRMRISPAAAARLVTAATHTADYATVRDGLRDGTLNTEQAKTITDAISVLPLPGPAASLAERSRADAVRQHAAAFLTSPDCRALAPKELAIVGASILRHVAPDVADRVEQAQLERSERDAYDRRHLTLSPQALGGVKITGHLTDEAAAYLRAAIDSVTAPRATGRCTGTRPDCNAEPASSAVPADSEEPVNQTPAGDDVILDDRSPRQKRADALEEVCKLALRTGELPEHGGDRPHLNITIPYDTTTGTLGNGTLDTGETIHPETVRRLACDANILPAILDHTGQILDLGRARRLITGPLRRALVLRDAGCAFPGCDRPPKWCEGHHITGWAEGGPTSLPNSVLLCGHHHRVIHHSQWKIRLAADGLPEFIPPPWIDRQQQPRRNHRITLRLMLAHQRRRQPAYHQRT